ncbi:alpha/beta hydrolase [Acinetobacter populi]|uniref:BD-FAE-like domain-containing protein n=1 Tax=Acinetobacter populi TaxID=1582270 RepID=A0A1Z9YXH0_9GAMM|nr:alpha/beta hydrolase [Acinetobacter populi]OUY06898.1 hypothetical protein CAP51_09375 [Acinetobacter populi]
MHIPFLKNFRWYDVPNYVLNQLTVGNHAQCRADLSYATASDRQKLDLYIPKKPRTNNALILFVHGGSWQHGSKTDYIFLAQNLAKYGFYVACMNYQLAPEHLYPTYVEDVIQAINWLSAAQQADQYGYAADQIILLGHSAGALNVMAAVYHGAQFQYSIQNLNAIRAIIGIAGPYSFEHRGDPIAQYAFDQTVAPELIMPSFFTFHNSIRHLLLLAGNDQLVGDYNTEKMQQALLHVQNAVTVYRIPATTHISIIATLAEGIDRLFKTRQVMLDFIDQPEVN